MGFPNPFRWLGKFAFGCDDRIGSPVRLNGHPLTPHLHPQTFRFVCDRCFEKVDVDKSGFLEVIEIEVAMLYLYNMVSKGGGGSAS